MKFLAILKDSFYETKDFKLFYILLGLSVLLTVGAASFRFPRLTVQTALESNLGSGLTASEVETLSESWLTPHARYRFTVSPTPGGAQFAEKLMKAIVARAESEEARRFKDRTDYGVQELNLQGNPFSNPMAMFESIEKAKKASIEEAKKRLLEDDGAQNLSRTQRLTSSLLSFTPGFRNVEVVTGFTPEESDARVVVEADVNWAELRNARQVGLLFGLVTYDLGGFSLGQFMFKVVLKPLIMYIAGLGGMIVALIVTAGFVPNMLHKGTVDLLLVKPISRVMLLCYKYLGGLLFVFFNALVLIGGTWIAFGFSTGNWSLWYLASVPVLTFYFAILYSLSVLLGVLTRGPLVPILVTIAVWMGLSMVSLVYREVHRPVAEEHLKES
jgi:ABC-type transport system involved in multi-copper enzyme maturation permease subunit